MLTRTDTNIAINYETAKHAVNFDISFGEGKDEEDEKKRKDFTKNYDVEVFESGEGDDYAKGYRVVTNEGPLVIKLGNIRIKNGIAETPSLLSNKPFFQKSKVWGKITARQELYLNYNVFEMKSLSLMLENMEKQITSKYAARIFDYDGDGTIDLTVESTPEDKYDDAFDILKRHKDEAINNQG
jgi:hypothetical protein